MEKLFSQFEQPHGRIGQLVGWFMSKENSEINKWTLDFLDIQDHEHVLELGFGSGKAIKYILKQQNLVTVTGIDPSKEMVYQALRNLNKHLVNSQVRLMEGFAEELPVLPNKIDKVLVINNIAFWEKPVETLKRNDGGKIALTIRPHEKGATDETSELTGGQLSALLTHAGFTSVEFFKTNKTE